MPLTLAFDDLLERLAEHKRLLDICLRTGHGDRLKTFLNVVVQAVVERDEIMQEDVVRRQTQNDKECFAGEQNMTV